MQAHTRRSGRIVALGVVGSTAVLGHIAFGWHVWGGHLPLVCGAALLVAAVCKSMSTFAVAFGLAVWSCAWCCGCLGGEVVVVVVVALRFGLTFCSARSQRCRAMCCSCFRTL